MNIAPAFKTFALVAAVCGSLFWGTQECGKKVEARNERDQAIAERDSVITEVSIRDKRISDLSGLLATCKQQASDAKAYAYTLADQLNEAVATVGRSVAGMSQQQQRIAALNSLVRNKSLPSTRLADLTAQANLPTPVQADSELVAAVAKTSIWLEIYQDSTAKLLKAVATAEGQTKAADQRAQNAEVSSIYAEDQFVEEAQTKRFLGKGRKKAMRKRAANVRRVREGTNITDLTK
ncbi:hypothetical protein [Spirosoma sordidisoli]|uniref:Uncharacterized protein n=1 Tax=Spirosoma sordidisoli TaxID=2502893 RepID=A0A4Q2UMJ1_9BACT|nr:hypothetical protein [Spirosoma sordidisoli]RYC70843.1 hypothetical protein EQG79_01445 [Spirosoma sordidisoli]